MKNKIFKALGVGAIATLGLFTFAGCSLSDKEKANVMDGLENANTYMEKTIDLLKEQNRKLNEQNNQLEEYIDEIKQENAKITTEEAWNKLLLAKIKLETNYNGIRDNIRITQSQDDYGIMVQDCFKSENHGFVVVGTSEITLNDGSYSDVHVAYENAGVVYVYRKDNINNTYSKYINERAESSEVYAQIHSLLGPAEAFDREKSEIIDVEILENGNYKLTVLNVLEEGTKEPDDGNSYYYEKRTYLLEYEITKDDIFVSINVTSTYEYDMHQESNGNDMGSFYGTENQNGIITFEYDVLEEDYISTILQEAINKELKSDE